MKTIHLNQQSAQNLSFMIRRAIYRLPYILLIRRFTFVRLGLLVILGLIALYIVVTLLYIDGSSDDINTVERPLVLQIETIDELELWVEERQTERERVIFPRSQTYFTP